MSATVTMFDSETVSAIPSSATLCLAYIDGSVTHDNAREMRARFPHAAIITCTVVGTPGARVCDIETGDMTPASGAAWAKNEVAGGRRPTCYMNSSTWPAVQAAVAKAGITGKVDYLVAAYDGKAVIPAGAVGKQYLGHPGDSPGNYDVSIVLASWVHPAPPAAAGPLPVPPHHRTPVAQLRALNPGVTGAFHVGQWLKVRSTATHRPPGYGWHQITGKNDGSWQALARLYP